MLNSFSRTELLLGADAMKKLASCRVAVFGLGGVGGFTVEALARSGVGALELVDDDKICLTNINRQIFATRSTIGKFKADVAAERVKDINPNCDVSVRKVFFMPDTADSFDFSSYDYVVDAIDTVTGKLQIIKSAKAAGVPVISCMGAGNKLDATAFEVADISKTAVCPLARTMRRELKKLGIGGVKVVFSKEEPLKPDESGEISCKNHCICPPGTVRKCTARRDIPGSVAFVPPVAGLIVAGEVIKDLTASCR